jgi:hypothetical protein
MTPYEIPLSPNPQTFAVALAGKTYQLTFSWNTVLLCWLLDIATEDRTPIVSGIPVVTGLDLLTQYAYLGIGGSLVVQTDGSASLVTRTDGNSLGAPVVGPGDWFIIGTSIIGGTAAIWGPAIAPTTTGPLLSANTTPNDVPDFANFGVAGRVYFVVTT